MREGDFLWQPDPPGHSGGAFQAAGFATTPPAAFIQPAAHGGVGSAVG